MDFSVTPPPISAYAPGTFALFTVENRLPKILADVRKQLHKGGKDPVWDALAAAIASGGTIDMSLFDTDSQFWRMRLADLDGTSWRDLPFFELEFLFYLAVNSIAHMVQPGFDVFASQRRSALLQAIPSVAQMIESTQHVPLQTALHLAVSGNEVDLSQLQVPAAKNSGSLLIDHSELLLACLSNEPERTIQILADNAGPELCFDLVLVDTLLAARTGEVVLQLKPNPMFVSDALVVDAEMTISEFIRVGGRLGHIGARLMHARDTGRLVLEAPPDWGEPRHIDALESELFAALTAASVVIVKGDLNYRRFFGDRAWPTDTPVRKAIVAKIMNSFALRVLKSDCLVGLCSRQLAQLSEEDPDWKSRGTYSIIQHITHGED